MANTMTKEERLQNIIDNLDESEVLTMWNERCDSNYYDDDRIYYMSELDDLFGKMWASDFLDKFDRDFDGSDDYFKYGVWGVESFNDIYDVVDDDELITYIIDEDEDFNNDEIREILDAEEEEEEEEEADE